MRIGIRAFSTAGSVQFTIKSVESGLIEQLYFRADQDTSVRAISLSPYSKTPADQPSIAQSLSDYTLLVKGPPPGPAGTLDVGGLPAMLKQLLRIHVEDAAILTLAKIRLKHRSGVGTERTIHKRFDVADAQRAEVAERRQVRAIHF